MDPNQVHQDCLKFSFYIFSNFPNVFPAFRITFPLSTKDEKMRNNAALSN